MANLPDPLAVHETLAGKVTTALKDTVDTPEKLSIYYTPGVGQVSRYLAEHPEQTPKFTNTHNTVAIVSDGSAVLGLGDIGPEAALPVMEGKAMLFKSFADIDAIPLVLNTDSVDEIVATVKAIAPSVGGINLEDIKAPECFEVEDRLKDLLDIPVFHDDQHGTAIVVLAGLINAMKLTNRKLNECKVVMVGVGAAGVAIAKLLRLYGQPELIAVDSRGVINRSRDDLSLVKKQLLEFSNPSDVSGGLSAVLEGADVFIGVSAGGLLTQPMVESMNDDPIIFAMANPDPEIVPEDALAAGAAVVATGRSDFPNQINNALAFPGIFRGTLDNGVINITDEHKIAVAEAIAGLVDNLSAEQIVPSIFDKRLVSTVAKQIN